MRTSIALITGTVVYRPTTNYNNQYQFVNQITKQAEQLKKKKIKADKNMILQTKNKNPLHNFIRNIQFWKRWSTSPLQAEAPSLYSHAHAKDTHMRASSNPSLQMDKRELTPNKILSLISSLWATNRS